MPSVLRKTTHDEPSREARSLVEVVYVAGTGRSGSTVIEHHLAETLRAPAVGETVHLWSRGILGDHRCGCGEPFSRCPFWMDVMRTGRILERHSDALPGFWDRRWDRLRAIPLMLARGRRDQTLDAAARAYGDLFAAVAEVSGRAIVIESSKGAGFWLFLRLVPGIRVHTLHVVRDSRAVAFSWRRRLLRPELAFQRTEYMGLGPYWRMALKWLEVNLVFSTVRGRAHQGVFTTLRYEDFATAPESSLARVRERLGLDVSGPIDHSSAEANSMQHSVSGNPVRFQPDRLSSIKLDEEWRRSMPRLQRAVVTALSLPLLLAYGYLGPQGRKSKP